MGKKKEETTVSTQGQETDTTIAAIDTTVSVTAKTQDQAIGTTVSVTAKTQDQAIGTTVSVTAKTQDDKEKEESAASKEDGETGTTIAVSAGIGVFVVIVIIGVAVGMFLVRRKKMTAVAPHLQNTGVPDKIKPSFKKRDTIELTEVNTQ